MGPLASKKVLHAYIPYCAKGFTRISHTHSRSSFLPLSYNHPNHQKLHHVHQYHHYSFIYSCLISTSHRSSICRSQQREPNPTAVFLLRGCQPFYQSKTGYYYYYLVNEVFAWGKWAVYVLGVYHLNLNKQLLSAFVSVPYLSL